MNAKPCQGAKLFLAPLLLCSVASFHCGGRAQRQAAAPSAQPTNAGQQDSTDVETVGAVDYDNVCEGHMLAPEAKSEISQLWNEIRDLRQARGMSAEPLQSEALRLHALTVQELRDAGEHAPPKTQTCIDTCTLEDSICSNAERICHLAKELGNDAWASEKCDSAKASCEEATKQCTACVFGEGV